MIKVTHFLTQKALPETAYRDGPVLGPILSIRVSQLSNLVIIVEKITENYFNTAPISDGKSVPPAHYSPKLR